MAGRDYVPLKGTRQIKAGKASGSVSITPQASGEDGKISVVVQPGNGYTVDATARKVKIQLTD